MLRTLARLTFAVTLAVPICLYTSATPTVAEEAVAESISVFGDATLAVPSSWETSKPASSIIEHEYVAKVGEGDEAKTARVTMMAAGGDVQANIDRWKGQFKGGDAAAQKTETIKMGNWNVHVADLSGSFAETMGGGPFSGGKVVQREGYAMMGIILEHPEGKKYFIKVTGPMEVVKQTRPEVMKMLEALK